MRPSIRTLPALFHLSEEDTMTIDRTTVGDDRGELVDPLVGLTDLDCRERKGNPRTLSSQENADLRIHVCGPRH